MIRSAIKTTVKGDEDVKRFLRRAKGRAAEGSFVTIGVHEGAGHYDGDGAPTVVEVALWTEFGTRSSPERSWLRSTLDENQSLLNQWREEMIGNILYREWTVERALNTIGFRIQVLLQNKIKSNVPPPNAPGTVAEKGRDGVAPVTLIHRGLMLRSVTYQVHLGKE